MTTSAKKAIDRMAAQQFPDDDMLHVVTRTSAPLWHTNSANSAIFEMNKVPPTRNRWKLPTLIAAATLGVLVIGSTVVIPAFTGPSTYAVTATSLQYETAGTSTDTRALLLELANKARQQPPPRGTGPYHYLRTNSWYVVTSVTTDMDIVDARIGQEERESWQTADGAGRLEVARDGVRDGAISGLRGPQPAWPAQRTVDEIRNQTNMQRSAADWFNELRQMWTQQVVTPELQSTVLERLASTSEMTIEGTATDRAGRLGIAISTTDTSDRARTPNQRNTMILDPKTGMLLDFEQVAVERGDLPIATPATIGYDVILTSGYTENTETRP